MAGRDKGQITDDKKKQNITAVSVTGEETLSWFTVGQLLTGACCDVCISFI